MFSSLLSSLIVSLLLISSVWSLSSSKSPGDQFYLNKFNLQLPDSKASTIEPSKLENDYESQYFYTASDGSMTFYVKGGGGTTSGSKYPRSELRQICNPSASSPTRYNWPITSTNTIEVQYKIGKLDSSSRRMIIQQIKSKDGPSGPLLQVQYDSGKLIAIYKTNSAGTKGKKVTLGSVSGKFKVKTQVSGGYLKVWLNNSRKINVKVSSYWKYKNYFKAGNYMQSTSSSAYATVHVYYLKVSTSSSNCQYTSSSFTEDSFEDDSSALEATDIVGICIGVFIFTICAVGGFIYWRKRKIAKASQIKLEDNVKESGDNKGGDTPMMESDGAETAKSTGAYDMDEIEITVPVDDNDEENQNNDEQK